MYDIGQATRQGLAENVDTAALKTSLQAVAKQRWSEVDGAERKMAIGTPDVLTEQSSAIDREFFDYYDRVELIPFDKLTSFFRAHLTSPATAIAAANR